MNVSMLTENVSYRWGRYSSGQRGQTVNLLTYVFTGSNPVLPTRDFKFKVSD